MGRPKLLLLVDMPSDLKLCGYPPYGSLALGARFSQSLILWVTLIRVVAQICHYEGE